MAHNSRLYGVELDDISGRIAKQLYPKADIKICGYEKADYPDSFFDVAVGNIPFGQMKVVDLRYEKLNMPIHDYFIAKTLDKVRPGGVVAFVTSRYTMDKEKSASRRYFAQRAELLGAVRLPNTSFKAAAG
ncbi:MAG: class I SAM-dependent methyltransferase, partial [Cloacibacillus porcorum]|nr:class I SAM-dependent methyltransferase [Cloacibacillus porcorum]